MSNTVTLDGIIAAAFSHQKSNDRIVAAIQAAKSEGHDYKDLQRSFYIGELAGSLHPTAPKATPFMTKEAARILDLKNYAKKAEGDAEYRTKEQQRLCNTLRKAWQRIAFAAGLDAIDNRGGDQTSETKPTKTRVMHLRNYTPPAANTADEVIEFTLDLAGLVQKYVEQNSRIIPPTLRPVFASFLRGMSFATTYAPEEHTAAA